jgi:hypothetical protein
VPVPRRHGQRKVNILAKNIKGVMKFIAPIRRCCLSDDLFQKRGVKLVGDALGTVKCARNVEYGMQAPI